MESDSDMYEGSDVDSAGDDFYSDGEESDVEAAGDDFNPDDHRSDKNYAVLSSDDIRRLMDDDIARVSSVLSVSNTEASALLRRYNWSVSKVHEEWFADENKVREAIGSKIDQVTVKSTELDRNSVVACGICFEDYSNEEILASACGHRFCVECWQGYISNSISEGSGCLNLRCPEPSCKVAVSNDMISLLISDEDKRKYDNFLFRSYVEENRKIKWCPAPGCSFAVEFDIGSENTDVLCNCSNYFCWRCTEEAHRPVDCEMVVKWFEKNNAESENTNWILAYTKPCPKCKRPIEKNEGCMRMTCRDPCRYQFCWLCLNSWSIHGYNPCNRYQPGNDDEKQKEMAKQSIEKYTHYYERWAANEKSRKKAVEDLRRMEEVNVKELSVLQSTPETLLKFIIEAWKQIVECRRMLKWTYAYGFYLPDEEETKRQFFEYLQGQAEAGLERLHHCAEKELEIFLEEANSSTFNDFRIKLTGLTSVTKNYFENLLRALENGLEDVDSQGASVNVPTSSKNAAGSSRKRTYSRNAKYGGDTAARLRAGTEKLMTAMRTRNARLPITTNNTTGLRNALVAGGGNINTVPNLVMRGDNTLRKPTLPVEARGKQLLQIARLGNATGSSSTNDTLRNLQAVAQRQLLQAVQANNTTGSTAANPDVYFAEARGRRLLQLARPNNTASNPQLAGFSKAMNTGGGSVNAHMLKAHMDGSSSRMGFGASNTTGSTNQQLMNTVMNEQMLMKQQMAMLQRAPMAGSSSMIGVGVSNTMGNSLNTGGPANQQLINNTVMNIEGGNMNAQMATLQKAPMAGSSSMIGVGVSNTMGNALTTGGGNAHVHFAGMSKTARVGGSSSSRVEVLKKRRTSNGVAAPIIINLDDDDEVGEEATSGAGAPLTQNLNDDLVGWACDSCTFLNPSSSTTCVMCSEDASGSWECDKCTFVNNKDATSCHMCENTR